MLAEKVPAAQFGQVSGTREAVNVPPGQPLEESKQEVDPAELLEPASQGRQESIVVAAVSVL